MRAPRAVVARSSSPSWRRPSSSPPSGRRSRAAKDPPGLARSWPPSPRSSPAGTTPRRTPSSGAYGKYQIMPSNWPAWAASTSATRTRGRPRRTRRRSPPARSVALPLARQLASGRVLVAHRVDAHVRLVGLREALRRQGHAPLQGTPRSQGRRMPSRSRGTQERREKVDRLHRHVASPATAATPVTPSATRRSRRKRDVHVHGPRWPGTARSGRPGARPRSTSTARTCGPSTSAGRVHGARRRVPQGLVEERDPHADDRGRSGPAATRWSRSTSSSSR